MGGEFDFALLRYRSVDLERVWLLISVPKADDEAADAELTMRPDWKLWTLEEDHEYLEALLSDFLDDSVSDPFGLLSRISNLYAGVLVTAEAGSCDGESLAQLKRRVLDAGQSANG